MARLLHVTNGDSAGDELRRLYPGDDVVPWRDVLHEGPVPAGLSLTELAEARARFLADWGGASYEQVLADIRERDAALLRAPQYDEVCLWFEHDLYDQLQLLQVLDTLASVPLAATQLTLAQPPDLATAGRFIGLGSLTGEELATVFAGRQPVLDRTLEVGRLIWAAVRSPHPPDLLYALQEDVSAIPELRTAMVRLLQQYPSAENGLNRSEQALADAMVAGETDQVALFLAAQRQEEMPFLGDDTCFDYLDALCRGEQPIALRADRAYRLTEFGRRVQQRETDAVLANGIDRWLGGVHLHGRNNVWRWDEAGRTLVQ